MSNRRVFGRREFLAGSSAFVVAAALSPRIFGEGEWAPKRLAIGFSPAGGDTVFDASLVASGDGGFVSRGARVTVSGTSGAVEQSKRRGVEILAHFSYHDGAQFVSTPFRAWAGGPRSRSRGGAVPFTMPLDHEQKLAFTLGALAGKADDEKPDALPVTLSIQDTPGALKLVRGSYVIVPLSDNASEPRWSAWTLKTVNGRDTLADADGNAAPFEHFVLKVDYAKA